MDSPAHPKNHSSFFGGEEGSMPSVGLVQIGVIRGPKNVMPTQPRGARVANKSLLLLSNTRSGILVLETNTERHGGQARRLAGDVGAHGPQDPRRPRATPRLRHRA